MPNSPSLSRFCALSLALAAVFGLESCGMFKLVPPDRIAERKAVVPPDFLFNWDQDYNDWMDTPVKVQYGNVPLSDVFQRHPFTRLSYQWAESPPEMPLVSVDLIGISRRQYLWALAHDNNLRMSLRTNSAGEPETVIIWWTGLIKTGGVIQDRPRAEIRAMNPPEDEN